MSRGRREANLYMGQLLGLGVPQQLDVDVDSVSIGAGGDG